MESHRGSPALAWGLRVKGFSVDRRQSELEEHKRRRLGSLSSVELQWDGSYDRAAESRRRSGLKFAGEFSGATFFEGDFTSQLQATGVNASAYFAKRPNGNIAMIVLNKMRMRT